MKVIFMYVTFVLENNIETISVKLAHIISTKQTRKASSSSIFI